MLRIMKTALLLLTLFPDYYLVGAKNPAAVQYALQYAKSKVIIGCDCDEDDGDLKEIAIIKHVDANGVATVTTKDHAWEVEDVPIFDDKDKCDDKDSAAICVYGDNIEFRSGDDKGSIKFATKWCHFLNHLPEKGEKEASASGEEEEVAAMAGSAEAHSSGEVSAEAGASQDENASAESNKDQEDSAEADASQHEEHSEEAKASEDEPCSTDEDGDGDDAEAETEAAAIEDNGAALGEAKTIVIVNRLQQEQNLENGGGAGALGEGGGDWPYGAVFQCEYKGVEEELKMPDMKLVTISKFCGDDVGDGDKAVVVSEGAEWAHIVDFVTSEEDCAKMPHEEATKMICKTDDKIRIETGKIKGESVVVEYDIGDCHPPPEQEIPEDHSSSQETQD